MSALNNLLLAFRIGNQGVWRGNYFEFAARKDCDIKFIDKSFYIDITDANQLAQIAMMRYADSFLKEVFISDLFDYNEFERAVAIILDLDSKLSSHKIAKDTMVCGARLLKLVFIKYELHTKFSIQSKELIDILDSSIRELVAHLLINCKNPNNHDLQGAHALFVASTYYDDSSLRSSALGILETLLNKLIGTQGKGLWQENSSEYHFYGIQLLSEMNSCGWYSDTSLPILLANMLKSSRLLFASTIGDVFGFGDTDKSLLKRQISSGVFEQHFFDVDSVDLSDGVVTSRKFDGEVNSSLCAINFYHSPSHNHHDYMSFEWYYKDQFIIIDPGKFTYTNGQHKSYSLSYVAHNTVDLSALNHIEDRSKKFINGFLNKNNTHNEIVMSIVQPNFTASRSISHFHRRVVIEDDLFVACGNELSIIRGSLNFSSGFQVISHVGNTVVLGDGVSIVNLKYSCGQCEQYFGSNEPFLGWHCEAYQRYQKNLILVFSRSIIDQFSKFTIEIEIS